MEPVAILLILLVLAFIVIFITRPFFERTRVHPDETSQELSALLAERERLLTALQELDSDHALGKIPAEDYPAQRTELLHKGAEILRQIDVLSPDPVKKAGRKKADGLFSASTTPAALSDDTLEDMLADRRRLRNQKTAGFCPKCGKPVMQSDVFCPSCGNSLHL